MTAISVLIAEDEQPQRQALQKMLQELMPEAEIVAVCEDGLSALEAMQQFQPNLALLDIRMPGLSGLEVARSAGAGTQIVFTTAYDEYAVKAFEAGAVDYLLKPIKPERLQQAIEFANVSRRKLRRIFPISSMHWKPNCAALPAN